MDPKNGKCDTEGWIPRMVSVIQRGGSWEGGVVSVILGDGNLSVIQRGGFPGMVSVIERGGGKCMGVRGRTSEVL